MSKGYVPGSRARTRGKVLVNCWCTLKFIRIDWSALDAGEAPSCDKEGEDYCKRGCAPRKAVPAKRGRKPKDG